MPSYIPLENDLKRVVNNAPLIVFQIDKNGIFTLSEGASLKILGLEPGQVVGQSLFELYKDYPIIIDSIHKVLNDGLDNEYVAAITNDLFFETKLSAVIQSGEIVGVNGVSTNISKEIFLERELRQSEEQYRVLVESAPFGILVTQNAITQFVNKRFAEIFGYDNLSDFSGIPQRNFFAPQEREKLIERSNNRQKGITEPKSYETIGLTKKGKEFPLRVSVESIDYLGKPAQMTFFQDITEQKKTEEQNQIIMKQIMQTQKLESLGILAGGIAHDFNNLLVGILGYASLVLEKISPEDEVYEYINKIEKTSRLASELTKQMLNYSGRGQFQKEIISLKNLIEENKHLFRSSVSKSHELVFDIPDNVPLIEIDTTQIRQVILNLLSNASESIDHSNGLITVTLSKIDLLEDQSNFTFQAKIKPGTYLLFEVSDNGKGIPKDIIENVFDPFFTTKSTGRGLGLAVVQGIIRGHSGAINIESELGKGTTFKIYLPVKKGLKVEPIHRKKKIIKEVKKGTILICDDEEVVTDVASKILKDNGYKIIIARDGAESINIYLAHQDEIDLVLLDLTMPKITGEEVFNKIREINDQVKIIISSGFNEKEVMVKFSGLKLSGFLQKPYSYKDLIDIVNRLLLSDNS